jgi:serine/threonine-protein kinase
MERLSQLGAGFSVFTGAAARVATLQTPGSPAPGPTLPGPPPTQHVEPGESVTEVLGASPVTAGVPPTARAIPAAPPTVGIPTEATPPVAAPGVPARPTAPPPPAQTVQPSSMPSVGQVFSATPGGPLMPGSRFGRYEVERHLGRGGMGDVYLVRDTVINRQAALKTIRPEQNLDPAEVIEMRQRFYREAQTAGKLTHPNIVTIYDVGEDLGMSYIVMEYVEGHTLAQWMKQQRFSVAQIKHVVFNAAIGLDYAHENGIFHRDVKPDNVMVSKSGIVKVMDFGIARVVESTLTRTGNVIGTPAYMSPEQVSGQKIDGRSDIFSLGVILYELLTGKKPFTGETMTSLMFSIVRDTPKPPSTIDSKIAPSWDEILVKAMAKDRNKRYASARDLAAAVRDAK